MPHRVDPPGSGGSLGPYRVVVCGEALIDLTPVPGQPPGTVFAHPGGGPLNTAVACARLGVPTGFLSRMSTDGFGRLLRAHLRTSGVDTALVVDATEPTSLAVVSVGEQGEAEYTFYVQGTADRGLLPGDLPVRFAPSVAALHVGTLSLVLEPGASAYETLIRRERGRRLVVLDPNCRPALIPDRTAYRSRLESWIAAADVVKASAGDLAWLYPAGDPATVAEHWHCLGAGLVVITDGPAGAWATTAGGTRAGQAAAPVAVADTIGAGDTFGAAVLCWLDEHDALSRAALDALDARALRAMLAMATRAAALTCTRPGADPPWRSEI